MIYLSHLLLLLLLSIPLSSSIRCIDCTYNGTSKHCNAACSGEVCAVWKWSERGKEFIRQGCLSGIAAKIGCRTNQVGASLCLCNDFDQCNTEHRSVSTVPTLPVVRLPSVDCVSLLHLHPLPHTETDDSPLQIESSHAVCHSDYCHFTRTESSMQSTTGNVSISLCSPHPEWEFDIRLHDGLLRGLHSNLCHSIKTTRQSREIQCVCSTNMCNRNMVDTVREGPLQCYTVEGATDPDKVDSNSLCRGDLCFVRRSEEGQFTKGCLSITHMTTQSHPYTSGNRSIFGETQWFCNDQLCNMNLDRLSKSLSKKVFIPFRVSINGIPSLLPFVSLLFLLFLA